MEGYSPTHSLPCPLLLPAFVQLVTEHDLISRSEAFEKAIAGGEKSTLQHYCMSKAVGMKDEDQETWSFLGLLFENDGRRELLKRLGFEDVLQEQQAQAAAEPAADGLGPDGACGGALLMG